VDSKKISIINKNAIQSKHKCEHESYEYYKYEVTKSSNENQCLVSIYEIPPQKANYPYHYHLKNEEVFYIISGEGILETPEGNITILAGDTIVCPASEGTAHRIVNSSYTERLVYFECDTDNSPDVIGYPNSDKIGIAIKGKPNKLYKNNTVVGYYDGE